MSKSTKKRNIVAKIVTCIYKERSTIGKNYMPEIVYSLDLCKRICREHARGASLTDITRKNWAPESVGTILEWANNSTEFATMLNDARVAYCEALVASTIEDANNERDPNRARVKIQAKQWIASKLAPQRYGDKVQVEVEHKLDLTQALERAKQRALLPMCDQDNEADNQLIDITPQSDSDATDNKSVGQDDAWLE